ncbi:MAG TPA: hypothetical protein VJT72_00790 [Pseudonocardiaceae bacterium]|nr:hypothetical protein [Pseudonocardiaceae bacterium]
MAKSQLRHRRRAGICTGTRSRTLGGRVGGCAADLVRRISSVRWGSVMRRVSLLRTPSTRRRRVLGEDHPHPLNSAEILAADLRALGQHEAAHQLDEDIESRRPGFALFTAGRSR